LGKQEPINHAKPPNRSSLALPPLHSSKRYAEANLQAANKLPSSLHVFCGFDEPGTWGPATDPTPTLHAIRENLYLLYSWFRLFVFQLLQKFPPSPSLLRRDAFPPGAPVYVAVLHRLGPVEANNSRQQPTMSLGAFTTTFSPPAGCLPTGSLYSITTGTQFYYLKGLPYTSSCFPDGYNPNQESFYTPATACPASYTPACSTAVTAGTATETQVRCCPQ
jgi:hypothetical protein